MTAGMLYKKENLGGNEGFHKKYQSLRSFHKPCREFQGMGYCVSVSPTRPDIYAASSHQKVVILFLLGFEPMTKVSSKSSVSCFLWFNSSLALPRSVSFGYFTYHFIRTDNMSSPGHLLAKKS